MKLVSILLLTGLVTACGNDGKKQALPAAEDSDLVADIAEDNGNASEKGSESKKGKGETTKKSGEEDVVVKPVKPVEPVEVDECETANGEEGLQEKSQDEGKNSKDKTGSACEEKDDQKTPIDSKGLGDQPSLKDGPVQAL